MITVTIIGIKKHSIGFINLFIPNGVPKLLIPYIMIIELISYLSRVLSLAIRLSTNMIAGHVLIYIIS
jgi:F-type H+-transporting ATPase subunit a